jgi:archaetidylinositol phosphate synthase
LRNDTWTHMLARVVARPMIGTGITPNHLTTLRLLTGVAACVLLALGPDLVHGALLWGGVLWVLSAFLDRVDGELARIGNMMTPGGHRYDYLVDNGVNSLFFLAIGIGLRHATLFGHDLGYWPIALGVVSSGVLLLCNWMSEIYEARLPDNSRIYSGAWGFHPDDALYLLGPAAWLGWLLPILLGATVGTSLMAVITAIRLLRLPRPATAITR